MKRTFFLRILSGYAAVILLLAAGVMLFAPPLMRTHNILEKSSSLEHLAVLLEPQIVPYLNGSGTGDLHGLIAAFSRKTGTRITVIDPAGEVLADSETDARVLGQADYSAPAGRMGTAMAVTRGERSGHRGAHPLTSNAVCAAFVNPTG